VKIYIDDLKNGALTDTEYIELNLEEVAEAVKARIPKYYHGFCIRESRYAEDMLHSTIQAFKEELYDKLRGSIKLNNSEKLMIATMDLVLELSKRENPTDVELQTMAKMAELLFKCI